MEIFLGWFCLSILAGVIAGAKGRSGFGYFMLSLLLSPLIGLIAAAAMPRIDEPGATSSPATETHVKCPDCAELVLRAAKVCKHCGCRLVPNADCKSCGKTTASEDGECQYCFARLS